MREGKLGNVAGNSCWSSITSSLTSSPSERNASSEQRIRLANTLLGLSKADAIVIVSLNDLRSLSLSLIFFVGLSSMRSSLTSLHLSGW
jgi:hypothetical protein